MPITKAECEAKGFLWNERTQTCTMPRITLIKMTLSRGPGCDGPGRVATIRTRLPETVQKVLLKAARKPKKKTGR